MILGITQDNDAAPDHDRLTALRHRSSETFQQIKIISGSYTVASYIFRGQ
jgi:hypothetical protein